MVPPGLCMSSLAATSPLEPALAEATGTLASTLVTPWVHRPLATCNKQGRVSGVPCVKEPSGSCEDLTGSCHLQHVLHTNINFVSGHLKDFSNVVTAVKTLPVAVHAVEHQIKTSGPL